MSSQISNFQNIDLSSVKGVLIDIDDTLYSYQRSHSHAIKACFTHFSNDFPNRMTFENFEANYRDKRNTVTQRLSPQGCCRSRLFAFQALFEELQVLHAFNWALKYEALYWEHLIDEIKIDEKALMFLQRCLTAKIPICAVSDMQAHFQVKKLQKLKIDHLISYMVTSEEAGIEKPAPEVFRLALSKLKLKSHEVIMIGDSQEKDIMGAEKLKIKAYKVEVN